jgi:hypothetical protein
VSPCSIFRLVSRKMGQSLVRWLVSLMWYMQYRIFCGVWALATTAATIWGSASLGVWRGSSIEGPWVSFRQRWSKILLPVLWWPMTIRINVVHRSRIAVLIIIVTASCSFIWFCHFPLLLELAEMQDLRLAEFCK